jgi:hypothetical protein
VWKLFRSLQQAMLVGASRWQLLDKLSRADSSSRIGESLLQPAMPDRVVYELSIRSTSLSRLSEQSDVSLYVTRSFLDRSPSVTTLALSTVVPLQAIFLSALITSPHST